MIGLLPNGPTRNSSLAQLSETVLNQIPNGPSYSDNAFIMSDAAWWAMHHARLEEAFQASLTTPEQQGAAGTTK